MLNNTLTVRTTVTGGAPAVEAIDRAYALQVLGSTSSTYSDPSATADEPRTLRVTHEVTGSGVVNSAMIIDQMIDSGDPNTADSILRGMVKLSYDPEFATKAQLEALIAELAVVLLAGFQADNAYDADLVVVGKADSSVELKLDVSASTGVSIAKFLNREH